MFKIIALLTLLEVSTQQVYPWEVFHPLHEFQNMESCTQFVDTNKQALTNGLKQYLMSNADYFGFAVTIDEMGCKDVTGDPMYKRKAIPRHLPNTGLDV